MSEPTDMNDLRALMAGGELDQATIERLAAADRQAMRALLAEYLPDAEVDAILGRIAALIAALPR